MVEWLNRNHSLVQGIWQALKRLWVHEENILWSDETKRKSLGRAPSTTSGQNHPADERIEEIAQIQVQLVETCPWKLSAVIAVKDASTNYWVNGLNSF